MTAIQAAMQQAGLEVQLVQQQQAAADNQGVKGKLDPDAPCLDIDGKQLAVDDTLQLLAINGAVAAIGKVMFSLQAVPWTPCMAGRCVMMPFCSLTATACNMLRPSAVDACYQLQLHI